MRYLVFVAVVLAGSVVSGQDFSVIKKVASVFPRISLRLSLAKERVEVRKKKLDEAGLVRVKGGVLKRCFMKLVNGKMVMQ
tara:strand:- start:261 stop:503 length:243 start_codon:yes stop_codon:yes gene_type:complete